LKNEGERKKLATSDLGNWLNLKISFVFERVAKSENGVI
jgi:hypothetical protein